MSKYSKLWAFLTALATGFVLSGGCGWNLNGQWGTILAILQEDLFG